MGESSKKSKKQELLENDDLMYYQDTKEVKDKEKPAHLKLVGCIVSVKSNPMKKREIIGYL